MKKNLGFDPQEIALLRQECTEEGHSFVFVENEDDSDAPVGEEFAQIQFVGNYEGKEVIFDAIIYTLRMHFTGLVYEEAESRVAKQFPLFVPYEMRDENFKPNEKLDEEVEMMITEVMDEIEENEEIKISEHIEYDTETEYGIGLDVCLNIDEITPNVIDNFVQAFNDGKFVLDETLVSFHSEEDDDI